jgi:pimeloyl-ACP methyl ester carboxylesterase
MPPPGIGPVTGWRRVARGLASWLLFPLFLFGRVVTGRAGVLDDPAREADGLTLVLTGVQGRSFLEQQIALGIADAGVAGRVEIVDWTTGHPILMLYHLRAIKLAARAAARLAERIAAYRREYPGKPVHVVGYSGGGYVTIRLLEALPPDVKVTSAVLLAPSVSPFVDVVPLAGKTERGLTHFWSPYDVPVLGLLTLLVGTTDGWHSPSAGLVGFHPEEPLPSGGEPPFREVRYRFRWLGQFHYGGHLGWASRVWACETLGRLVVAGEIPEESR